eukprot:145607-Rhodomonas_salina.2
MAAGFSALPANTLSTSTTSGAVAPGSTTHDNNTQGQHRGGGVGSGRRAGRRRRGGGAGRVGPGMPHWAAPAPSLTRKRKVRPPSVCASTRASKPAHRWAGTGSGSARTCWHMWCAARPCVTDSASPSSRPNSAASATHVGGLVSGWLHVWLTASEARVPL